MVLAGTAVALATVDGGLAAATGDEVGVGAAHLHPVVAGMLDDEDRVRRAHLQRDARLQGAQVERHAAAGDLELDQALLLLQQRKLAVLVGTHETSAAKLHLEIGIAAGIERIAFRQRQVRLGAHPVIRTLPPIGHLAVNEA